MHTNHLELLLKYDYVSIGPGLSSCISNKLPGDISCCWSWDHTEQQSYKSPQEINYKFSLKSVQKKNPENIIPLPLLATFSSSSHMQSQDISPPNILNLCNKKEWTYSKVLHSVETRHSHLYNWFRCSKIIKSTFVLLLNINFLQHFSICFTLLPHFEL